VLYSSDIFPTFILALPPAAKRLNGSRNFDHSEMDASALDVCGLDSLWLDVSGRCSQIGVLCYFGADAHG
jgi:hypothetical protein